MKREQLKKRLSHLEEKNNTHHFLFAHECGDGLFSLAGFDNTEERWTEDQLNRYIDSLPSPVHVTFVRIATPDAVKHLYDDHDCG